MLASYAMGIELLDITCINSMPYTFLFSYDRDSRAGCEKKNRRTGETYNLMDDFYGELRDLVQSGMGSTPGEVGWFDQNAIEIGVPWPVDLAQAVRTARVLLAVVTPGYFEKENCGREFYAFLKRYDVLKETSGQDCAAPIIPFFWEDKPLCFHKIPDRFKEFFDTIQFRQWGMPEDYPTTGYRQFVELGRENEKIRIIYAVRQRICELAKLNLPPLHPLVSGIDFRNFPSPFTEGKNAEELQIDMSRGPSTPDLILKGKPLPSLIPRLLIG